MTRIRSIAALSILGAAAWAAPTGLDAQDDRFEWSGRMTANQVLEVKGISGNIRAVLAAGDRAEVVAIKTGRESDFDDVEVHVVEHRDGVTVCVFYAWWEEGRDACDHDGDGGHRRHNIRAGVDYEVRVPAGVEFIGATVSGDVDVDGLRSEVTATTVSGDVYVSTTDVAWGSTVSGSIEIEMGGDTWDDLSFSTVSGDITLYVPAGLDADVEFKSLSGDFHTDFDIEMDRQRRRWVGSEVEGRIGRGGRSLSFKTVSGDVSLRELRR